MPSRLPLSFFHTFFIYLLLCHQKGLELLSCLVYPPNFYIATFFLPSISPGWVPVVVSELRLVRVLRGSIGSILSPRTRDSSDGSPSHNLRFEKERGFASIHFTNRINMILKDVHSILWHSKAPSRPYLPFGRRNKTIKSIYSKNLSIYVLTDLVFFQRAASGTALERARQK